MTSHLTKGVLLIAVSAMCGVGCQSSGEKGGVLRAGIPPQAEAVQEGSEQIVYTSDAAGRVYLYDKTRDEMVGRYQVRSGQRLAVDARAGRATLDGNEVSTGKLRAGSTYQVYFLPG